MMFCNFCCGRNKSRMRRRVSILVLGLDYAGKSSIIKRLQGEPVVNLLPTVGSKSVVVPFSNKYEVFLCDLGGSENFRAIWKQYLGTAYGVIYVVDSLDFQRVEENRQVFEQLLSDVNMKYKPLLLLANKQDSDDAMDEVDIVERLNVHTLVNMYKCPTTIELCSTVEPPVKSKKVCGKKPQKKDGIKNGFRWLMKQIDEYYDDLELRIADIKLREQREYAEKREKWMEEKRLRDGSVETDEEEEENGNPFRSVDEILSAKSLTNGFKRRTEEPRDDTDLYNFQIKNSCENLLNTATSINNHDDRKKKNPKKRKKKVTPLNTNDVQNVPDAELPPLRVPARNVNMAWTEESQIVSNEDAQSRETIVENVEYIRSKSTNDSESQKEEANNENR